MNPINSTEIINLVQGADFDIISNINQHPKFLIPLILLVAIPMFFYLLSGIFIKGKRKRLIQDPKYWLLFSITFGVMIIILLFIVLFPVYLMIL